MRHAYPMRIVLVATQYSLITILYNVEKEEGTNQVSINSFNLFIPLLPAHYNVLSPHQAADSLLLKSPLPLHIQY